MLDPGASAGPSAGASVQSQSSQEELHEAGQLGEPGVVPAAVQQRHHSVMDLAIAAAMGVIHARAHVPHVPQMLSPIPYSEESDHEDTHHPPMAPGDQVQHSQVGSMTPASPRGVVVCRAMGDADIAPEVTDSQV